MVILGTVIDSYLSNYLNTDGETSMDGFVSARYIYTSLSKIILKVFERRNIRIYVFAPLQSTNIDFQDF